MTDNIDLSGQTNKDKDKYSQKDKELDFRQHSRRTSYFHPRKFEIEKIEKNEKPKKEKKSDEKINNKAKKSSKGLMIPYKYFKEIEQEKNDLSNKLSILTAKMVALKRKQKKVVATKDQSLQANFDPIIQPSTIQVSRHSSRNFRLNHGSSISLEDSDTSDDQRQMIEDLLEEVSYLKKKNKKYKKQAKKYKEENSKLKKIMKNDDKMNSKMGIVVEEEEEGEGILRSRSNSRSKISNISKKHKYKQGYVHAEYGYKQKGKKKKKISWKEQPTLENATFVYPSSTSTPK